MWKLNLKLSYLKATNRNSLVNFKIILSIQVKRYKQLFKTFMKSQVSRLRVKMLLKNLFKKARLLIKSKKTLCQLIKRANSKTNPSQSIIFMSIATTNKGFSTNLQYLLDECIIEAIMVFIFRVVFRFTKATQSIGR